MAQRLSEGGALLPRLVAIGLIVLVWQALAYSGLFFRDVIPPLQRILLALGQTAIDGDFHRNLMVTLGELVAAVAIGTAVGLAVGLVLGASWFLSRAYEPFLHYLGPTPKIIFFPVLLMWFGVGPGSKVAMGAISCFFPVAISIAAGMRGIDRTLIRVGRSFRASTLQMVTKIYLPALRAPLINGLRLGLGIAIIGILLAETKLSNRGIGYLIIQSYVQFDMPRMYSLLIFIIGVAAALNAVIGRAAQRVAGGRQGG